MTVERAKSDWLRADFNGLFGDVLCLSHSDTCDDFEGRPVKLSEGMFVTTYDQDSDENGKRDDLIASGRIERSPGWLSCKGSRWVLKIDEHGVRNESDLKSDS
jgi:hypothetical protein